MVIVSRVLGKIEVPKNRAYLNPKSGITYTNGISDITPSRLSVIASLISNNTKINNSTQTVYVDYADDYEEAHYKIDVGNTVSILVDEENYDFRIVGFNHDDLTSETAYSEATKTGKAGITFQMVDCLYTRYSMNSSNTNSGGWDTCEFRTTHLPILKNTMDTAWSDIIKEVNKKTSAGEKSSTINTVSDGLFLLSTIEVFGEREYSFAGEGDIYAYWSANNTNSARIKKRNGSAYQWWQRSPRYNANSSFCIVGDNGASSTASATNTYGISLSFCV